MPAIAWTSAALMLAALSAGCATSKRSRSGEPYSTDSASTAAVTTGAQNASSTDSRLAPTNVPPPPAAYSRASGNGGNIDGGNTALAAAPVRQTNGVSFLPQDSSSSAMANYSGQKTCPVTGAPLGSIGSPVPVAFNGQTYFVCCEGCIAKFQSDPGLYASVVDAERNPNRSYVSASSTRCTSSSSGCASGRCGCR